MKAKCALFLSFFLFIVPRFAAAQPIEVLWLGHATTRITSVAGKVIVIDPFLTRNPRTPPDYRDLKAVGKVDLILVTHGHQDHISDLLELARLTGAKVLANYEFGRNLVSLGLLEENNVIAMNKGRHSGAARSGRQDPHGASRSQLITRLQYSGHQEP